MRIIATFSSLLIASAIVVAGCKAPASEDVNAAKPAGDEATASASKSAGDADEKKVTAKVRKPADGARASAARSAVARAREAAAVTPPTKIKDVQPVYPAIARAANVEGTVLLTVEVDKNGKVSDAKVIRSSPLLDKAALDAVRQWEYTPMRKGNVAVPTTMTVRVNFVRS